MNKAIVKRFDQGIVQHIVKELFLMPCAISSPLPSSWFYQLSARPLNFNPFQSLLYGLFIIRERGALSSIFMLERGKSSSDLFATVCATRRQKCPGCVPTSYRPMYWNHKIGRSNRSHTRQYRLVALSSEHLGS